MTNHDKLMAKVHANLEKRSGLVENVAPSAGTIGGAVVAGGIASKAGKFLPKKYRALATLLSAAYGGYKGNKIGKNFAANEFSENAARDKRRIMALAELNRDKSALDAASVQNYRNAGLLPNTMGTM